MFNIGMAELLLILVVAFVLVGPKDLPRVARALGRFVRYIRNIINEVKRETGLDEVSDEIKGLEKDIKETVSQVDVSKDIHQAQRSINKGLKAIEKEISFTDFKNNQTGGK